MEFTAVEAEGHTSGESGSVLVAQPDTQTTTALADLGPTAAGSAVGTDVNIDNSSASTQTHLVVVQSDCSPTLPVTDLPAAQQGSSAESLKHASPELGGCGGGASGASIGPPSPALTPSPHSTASLVLTTPSDPSSASTADDPAPLQATVTDADGPDTPVASPPSPTLVDSDKVDRSSQSKGTSLPSSSPSLGSVHAHQLQRALSPAPPPRQPPPSTPLPPCPVPSSSGLIPETRPSLLRDPTIPWSQAGRQHAEGEVQQEGAADKLIGRDLSVHMSLLEIAEGRNWQPRGESRSLLCMTATTTTTLLSHSAARRPLLSTLFAVQRCFPSSPRPPPHRAGS